MPEGAYQRLPCEGVSMEVTISKIDTERLIYMAIAPGSVLKLAGVAPFLGAMPLVGSAAAQPDPEKPDCTVRIGTGLVELAPDHIVSTTLYNGQFSGPLLRFKEGRRSAIGAKRTRNAQYEYFA
jgi:hypothetical protein